MRKLKTIVQSNNFYVCLMIITILYIGINIAASKIISENHFEGKIIEYTWKKKYIEVVLKQQNIKKLIKIPYKERKEWEDKIKYGNLLSGSGKIVSIENNTIPNTFNQKKYLLSENIYSVIEADDVKVLKNRNVLYNWKQNLRDIINTQENAGYKKLLLLGIKEDMQEKLDNFANTGISHIFAISGMHISFLCISIKKIGKKFKKSERQIDNLIAATLILYFFLLKKSISSSRAIFFFLLKIMNKKTKLNIKTSNLFFLVVMICLWKKPLSIYQVGFWYTFTLSFFFMILKPQKKSSNLLRISLISFFISLPITIQNKSEINPWSILINVIMIPIISGLMYPSILLSTILKPFSFFANGLIHIVESLNLLFLKLPLSSITIPKMSYGMILLYYVILFLIIKRNKQRYKIIMFFFLLYTIFYPKLDSNAYFYFLDVSQGDSTLIISPFQKEVILIDTGKENEYLSNNISQFLKSIGITKINYLILSHGDNDHAGSAAKLLETFKIDHLILNQGTINDIEQKLKNKYSEKIQNHIRTKKIKITELSHSVKENENDNSKILHICLKNVCTLFMGDASINVEEELINHYRINTTILKVGHHGSQTSSSSIFLEKIKPLHAIISAGRNNHYEHPHETVIRNLEKQQIKIHSTQNLGTIKLKISKRSYTFSYNPP